MDELTGTALNYAHRPFMILSCKDAGTIHTKRELIETALREFVKNKKVKNLRDLKGKILFADDYDYKKMRAGK
jgi:hypothetical protein